MVNRAVKFLREYVVNNGSGNPPGPHFKAGAVYQLPDDQADFWLRTGHAVVATAAEEADAAPVGAETTVSGDGLDSMKSRDLINVAEAEKIDLGSVSKKSEIVAAIRAARAARLTPVPAADPPAADPPA